MCVSRFVEWRVYSARACVYAHLCLGVRGEVKRSLASAEWI